MTVWWVRLLNLKATLLQFNVTKRLVLKQINIDK